jgi:serine-type D-Ala-D-Ala carboxypeptidase
VKLEPPKPNAAITSFLTERVQAGDFPSAVYLVAEKGKEAFSDAIGHAVLDPYRIEASVGTIYDLASLTKPLVTGFLCALAIERGELELDRAVSEYLPQFETRDKAEITIRQLLTHSSGFPAWRPLYILTDSKREKTLEAIAREPLEYSPGTRVIYSDLGFITLGFLLEKLTSMKFADLARAEIFQPLKLESTFFSPETALQTGIAACESGNAYERSTTKECGFGEYHDWRTRVIWGEVHDANGFFLGGSAGHAGLFADVRDVWKMASQFLAGQTRLLKPETCALFRTNFTDGLEEARSIGWQLAMSKDSTGGKELPPDSFGHNGFTGTCCWNDPVNERTFVLLTNRTHARSLPFVNINSVRRQFHSLAVKALT